MEEQKVLAACLHNKSAFEKVKPFLERGDFSAAGFLVLEEIVNHYACDPQVTACDPDLILASIKRRLANPKQYDTFLDIVRGLRPEVASNNVAQDYLEVKRHAAGDRLAGAIGARRPRSEIDTLSDEFAALQAATELEREAEEYVEQDWEKLIVGETDARTKIRLLPGALNARVGGGVRRGDCIVLFGRPNAGKSLFAINAAVGFINQGLKVLWIENEDRGNRTKLRFASRLLGMPPELVSKEPQESARLLLAKGAERFTYLSLTPGNLQDIEQGISDHKPDVFFVNQLRNIMIPKVDSLTVVLDKGAQRCRSLGKKNNAISFLITQAHAPTSAFGQEPKERPVLYMEDVDSSRTGLAAAADVMIGYGITRELRDQKLACINICKNKNGPEEHFYVRVDPAIDKLTTPKGNS